MEADQSRTALSNTSIDEVAEVRSTPSSDTVIRELSNKEEVSKAQTENLLMMDNSEDEFANIDTLSSDAERKAQTEHLLKCCEDGDYDGTEKWLEQDTDPCWATPCIPCYPGLM